jgi:hypothetical protein
LSNANEACAGERGRAGQRGKGEEKLLLQIETGLGSVPTYEKHITFGERRHKKTKGKREARGRQVRGGGGL